MSIVFSKYDTSDGSKNGYFRIGHIVFDIPPINIITDRITNNDRRTTLRGKNEMFVKSGQARWDVTVTWIAMYNGLNNNPWSEWEKVQDLVAVFKAAPFVEVENAHIRQIFTEKDPEMQSKRLAFALRQMKVETHPDIIDALNVTIVMTYFNYNPYSKSFGYIGESGANTGAYNSTPFKDYINTWKSNNLISPEIGYTDPDAWKNIELGEIDIQWKRWTTLAIVPLSSSNDSIATTSPSSNSPVTKPTPIIPNTNLNPKVVGISANYLNMINEMQPAAAAAVKQWLQQVSDSGYDYKVNSTLRSYATQAKLYADYKAGKNKYIVAPPGHSNHEKGLAIDVSFTSNSGMNYAGSIAPNYGLQWLAAKDSVHFQYIGPGANKAPVASDVIKPNPNIDPKLAGVSQITPEMKTLSLQGWIFDHNIEDQAFFYQNQDVNIRTLDKSPRAPGLIPIQVSVLFINNLAQIPLASYQYPTYQHVGPAASVISIQMTSQGDTSAGEPVHEGLSELSSMMHTLEDQYRFLRTSFRSVRSAHDMDGVYVNNSVLNMLGIFGVMPEQLSTENVAESSDLVQVNFIGHQYENIYESVDAYTITGLSGNNLAKLQQILAKYDLSTFLPEVDRNRVTNIIQFQKDSKALNEVALGNWILMGSQTNQDWISSVTNNVMIPFTKEQAAIISKNPDPEYAILAARSKIIASTGNGTYIDWLGLQAQRTFDRLGSKISGVDVTVERAVQGTNIIGVVYQAVISALLNHSQIFGSEVQALLLSPLFKDITTSGATNQNPSASNPGHGAYLDLGLPDTINGLTTNPAMYFVSDQDQYNSTILNTISKALIVGQEANTTSGENVTNVATSLGLPSDVSQLNKMITSPGYSMKEAFPTFKLFLMEDANNGLYKCFDNFYSYSTVQEIEILRPYDKPATVVVKLTNLANLLSHKLYDNTLVGNYEKGLNRWVIRDNNPEALGAEDSSIISVNKNVVTGQVIESGEDNSEGYPGHKARIPLRYFPLQTGSKIQIRMGFENDPDKLEVVFNGIITALEDGDEIGDLILTAQSFLLELATVSAVQSTQTNTWLTLNSILHPFKGGPAFGGIGLFTDNGDTDSVISALLKNPAAKHFGHWQLNTETPDHMLKGYKQWTGLVAAGVGVLGYKTVADRIKDAYDRSGENIMVSNYIDYSGAILKNRGTRSYFDQESFDPGHIFEYWLDSKCKMSLWELIQDVARKIPEFVVLEKFYGFPYEANATMVYGHPLDWYYSRQTLLGEQEAIRELENNNVLYNKWYNDMGGKDKIRNGLQAAFRGLPVNIIQKALAFIASSTGLIDARIGRLVDQAAGSYENFDTMLTNTQSSFDQTNLALSSSSISAYQSAFSSIRKQYTIDVVQMTGATTSNGTIEGLKPIRRYHLIDNQSIVHNGIKVNDKIYNGIKICFEDGDTGSLYKVNTNIPDQHIRMLDVTDRINDPNKNVLGTFLRSKRKPSSTAISQSFMKEEVGKMYRGEIILRGMPQIEPLDILLLCDPSTSIVGPVEVEQVIHSFSQDQGYITIVKPRCIVCPNERASANGLRVFGLGMAEGLRAINGLTYNSIPTDVITANATAELKNNSVTDIYDSGMAVGAVLTPATPTLGMIWALTGAGIYSIVNQDSNDNLVVICPLTRFGRPWLGGLEGFELTSLEGHFNRAWTNWKAAEIYPLLDTWKKVNKIT